jgi:hypothetical protein
MGTAPLKGPPTDLHRIPLNVVSVSPSKLIRVSWHNTGEPHFGRTGTKRFDDKSRPAKNRVGTCYLGMSLLVAFAESVLHDREPNNGAFEVPSADIDNRFAVSFSGPDLRLAVLAGPSLKLLGGSAQLTGTSQYKLPREWARAIVRHPDNVDGFIYVSRHINDDYAVVLFERDSARPLKMTMKEVVSLSDHPDFVVTMKALNVKPS